MPGVMGRARAPLISNQEIIIRFQHIAIPAYDKITNKNGIS
jgi:hypothetical protein